MEQCNPFGVVYLNEEEGVMSELSLRQYIWQTRMEMEATVLAAQEELLRKSEELAHFKELLMLTIKERDEAQSQIQRLTLEKLLLQQKVVSLSKTKAITTNCRSASSSDSEESSIISSPRGSVGPNSPVLRPPLPPPPLALNPTASAPSGQLPPQIMALLASSGRPLPEKGKFLKAVMEAGPLLQTLLLAGPLPQWQHPPPRLNSIEIPPVSINPFSSSSGKRGLMDGTIDGTMISSPKCQRVS